MRRLKMVLRVRPFFFSSRRRHTRYIGDWSSDVCSSDLQHAQATQVRLTLDFDGHRVRVTAEDNGKGFDPQAARSEERRVGKGCRGRWAREHIRKKRTEHREEDGLSEKL